MVSTPDQIAAAIIAKLSVTDPALSLEIGSPERKIVDAVGEAISESTIDNYLLGYNLDIDSKSGTDLDNFVGIWGFARQSGRYATGTVDFVLSYPATNDVTIPVGTQTYVPASVSGTTDFFFLTTAASNIATGTQAVTVPVQCQIMGSIGNVASSAISGFNGAGVSSVTNRAPTSGGLDPETDDALRQRFKRTFLRNLTGTNGFYVALMLQNTYVSNCNVVGPYLTYREEVQFNGNVKMYSTNPDVKYLWPQGWFLFVDQGLPTETFYVSGVDYIVDSSVVPPGITPVHPDLLVPGAVADFEYQYTTSTSRNDPASGVANKIDVFIDGFNTLDANDSLVATNSTFSNTTTDPYYVGNFIRTDRTSPVAGHVFQPLGSVPIVSPPPVIYAPLTTYVLGTDYVGVETTTFFRGSTRGYYGIEWLTTAPGTGTLLYCTYTYNHNVELMQGLMNAQKQLTTDVLIRQADYRPLYFSFVISYDYRSSVTTTQANVTTAVTNYVARTPFGAWIQISDLLNVVHMCSGVDNVRLAMPTDVTAGLPYGVAARFNGTVLNAYVADFRLNDNELPLFDGVQFIRRSQNTFGS